MKHRIGKESTVQQKRGQSHVSLLIVLMALNSTLMVMSAWSQHRATHKEPVAIQSQASVEPLKIRNGQEDQLWSDLILRPLRRLYVVIGFIPLVLIGFAVYRDRVRNRLTWLSYAAVLIMLTATLALASYFTDLAGLSLLTDQAYLGFSRQNDFMRGFLTWLPGAFGLALLVVGLTMRPRQHA